jgi:hypothetical protein
MQAATKRWTKAQTASFARERAHAYVTMMREGRICDAIGCIISDVRSLPLNVGNATRLAFYDKVHRYGVTIPATLTDADRAQADDASGRG